jgi:hypothetical protein
MKDFIPIFGEPALASVVLGGFRLLGVRPDVAYCGRHDFSEGEVW